MQKGESVSLEIACAAIIARFYYLEWIRIVNEKFNSKIKPGASKDGDYEVAKLMQKMGGIKHLHKVAKVFFKNTDKVKEIIKKIN